MQSIHKEKHNLNFKKKFIYEGVLCLVFHLNKNTVFNHYIDVTDNISINLADLDNLNPPILNFNECNY